MQTKICTCCSENKALDEFRKDKNGPYGRTWFCKSCLNDKDRKYYLKNASRISKRTTEYEVRDLPNRLKKICKNAKIRRSEDFSVTPEFLMELYEKQNGLCAYTQMPLTYEANHLETVSLDRIDSSIGYLPDNVQLVCAAVNRMKLDMSEKDFLFLCEKITNNRHKTTQAA